MAISKQAVIMFLCLSHCFLISPGYKCGGSIWIFQEQTSFYLVRPIFFTFGISLRAWIKPRLWYGRNIIRIVDAISIFLCNHPQFHECIIQLFVGNEVFSIPEVICSYANNRDLLCLGEKNIYRSRSLKIWDRDCLYCYKLFIMAAFQLGFWFHKCSSSSILNWTTPCPCLKVLHGLLAQDKI